MSQLVRLALYPLLLLVSIPLMIFAFLTTLAASSTLLFRVLLVYADLAAVLIKNQLLHHPYSKSPSSVWPARGARASSSSSSSSRSHSRRRRRKSSSSSSDPLTFGGSRTPKSAETSGLGIYSAGSMQRDFEGVGGWRIPNTESEDILWTSMNARLELPAFAEGRHRHHRRAITSGGAPSSFRARQLDQYDGGTLSNARPVGTTSLEEYFINRHTSKSTTALSAANIGKSIQ